MTALEPYSYRYRAFRFRPYLKVSGLALEIPSHLTSTESHPFSHPFDDSNDPMDPINSTCFNNFSSLPSLSLGSQLSFKHTCNS